MLLLFLGYLKLSMHLYSSLVRSFLNLPTYTWSLPSESNGIGYFEVLSWSINETPSVLFNNFFSSLISIGLEHLILTLSEWPLTPEL